MRVEDVPLAFLHDLTAATSDNIVALIDAGFTTNTDDPRFVEPATGSGGFYFDQPERQLTERFQVGGLAVANSLRHLRSPHSAPGQASSRRRTSASRTFTEQVLRRLSPSKDIKALGEALRKSGATVISSRNPDRSSATPGLCCRANELIDRIENTSLDEARRLCH